MCLLRCRGLVVSILHRTIPTLQPSHRDGLARLLHACKQDTTVRHLTAYKRSKHRLLKLICKRVNTTLGALLCTVLTSFLRTNKNRLNVRLVIRRTLRRLLRHLTYVYLPTFYRLSQLTRRFEDRATQSSHSAIHCGSPDSIASAPKTLPALTTCSSCPSAWARRATRSPQPLSCICT